MLGKMPQLSGNDKEDITALYDYIIALRREFDDMLHNLDDDNFYKITAQSIDTSTLIVGDNIAMGPNAVISWGQVDGRPNTTYIDENGIYTGELTAEQITAGKISADMIDTTNLYAERIKQHGYPNNYGVIGGPLGGLALYQNNDHYFSVYKGALEAYFWAAGNTFLSSSDNGTYAYDDWDFSLASVSGIRWGDIESNPFDNWEPYDFVRNMSSQNLRMQVIEGSTENSVEIWDGSEYMGKVYLE